MVNLRHSDNIFYDREGDLFVITTDLDGRQEVVCKTNLECVSDVIARLLDINFKKVCDSENRLNMLDRKSTRLNSSHLNVSRMPSSA